MSRLFSAPAARADARPALLAVISLLLIVLPLLLASGERVGLSGLPLSVPADGALAPLPHPGPVQALVIKQRPDGFLLEAEVRATDLRAGSAPSTLHREALPDLPALQAALLRLKALDPARTQAEVQPLPDTRTDALVQLLDAVGSADGRPLFPDRVLRGAAP
ncbi:MAG: hypothetical protein RL071_3877 [Pseudomonadota bacterium]|jgi:hypothetical protein